MSETLNAACCLILRKNDKDELEVLATSRRNKLHLKGLPGGKSDGNELPLFTAIRETKEETGIDCLPKDMVLLYNAVVKGKRDDTGILLDGERDFNVYTFLANNFSGDPKTMESGVDVTWEPFTKDGSLCTGPFGNYNLEVMKAYFSKTPIQNMIKFVISCDIFGGWSFNVPKDIVTKMENMELVTNYVTRLLKEELEEKDLYQLLTIFKSKNFHIHGCTVEEIASRNILYICAHCITS